MNTTQRRDAMSYLLKAIAAAANDDNTPAAEALMSLYEVLKLPVPPCRLPDIVKAGMDIDNLQLRVSGMRSLESEL